MLHRFHLLTVSWFESLANTGGDRPMASQHIQKANMASTHPRSLILNHDATCASVCSTDQIYYRYANKNFKLCDVHQTTYA